MPKNNKHSPQPAHSRNQSSPRNPVPSSQQSLQQENSQYEHPDPNPSSPHRLLQGQQHLYEYQDSSNPSGSRSPPRYSKGKQQTDREGKGSNPKMSRIRQEQLSLKESKVSKGVKGPSIRGQDTPVYQQVSSRNLKHGHDRLSQEEQIENSQLPEEEKIKVLNANMEKLSDSLVDLRQNYNKLERDSSLVVSLKNSNLHKSRLSQELVPSTHFHKQSPQIRSSRSKHLEGSQLLKKSQAAVPRNSEEVLQFLEKKQKEKEERHKKLQKIAEKQRQKRQQEQREKVKQEQQFLQWRKSQIRQTGKIQEKRQKYKEKQQKGASVLQEFLKKWDGKSYLHEVKEKQFKEKISEEQRKKRQQVISGKKEVFKPMNLEEINQHEKWFYAKRDELDQLKQAAANEKLQKIQEENAALQGFWKGQAHELTAEERKQLKMKKKDPQDKAKKMKQYKQYILENFIPKGSKSQSAQQHYDSPHDPNKFMKVKRYRYYKGISYGEIVDTQPIAKNAEEIRRIGNSNMQIMKKIPKKRSHSPPAYLHNSFTPQPQRKFDMHMVHNIFSPIVQQHRQKQTKINLPQKIKRQDITSLLDRLKSYDTRIQEKQKALSGKRKDDQRVQEQCELNMNMVDNIQRKLSVLSQL